MTALAHTPDFKTLFSASADGTVFQFQLSEERINPEVPVLQEDCLPEQPRVTDPELDQIVLVSQNEMEQWLHKQAKLRHDLEQTRQKVKAKLLECKNSYKVQLEEISRQKELDIQDLQKRFNDLARQKDIQEKQNRQATSKLERYHYEEVKELEELY